MSNRWIYPVLMVLTLAQISHAQDSPCNQGRAEPPRVDPRHDRAICVPEIGRHRATIRQCLSPTYYEQFGQQVMPVSTKPGAVSWIISHDRCDTAPPDKPLPTELLLYRSNNGDLPSIQSGERIGPREVFSWTRFLAAGDWDNSGTMDLCCQIQLYGDTSAGYNPDGYDYTYVVVFWGDSLGKYSIDDTTQLECGATRWLSARNAASADLDRDHVDDLVIAGIGAGFSNGGIVNLPEVYIYGGDRRRWGHGGAGRSPAWNWWGRSPLTELVIMDQDGDGAIDVVFYSNTDIGTGHISVLYGNDRGFPDTTEREVVNLFNANGHASRLMDISNDGIPELVVHCGSEEQLAVFVGIRGQRLIEQYGPGHERFDTARGDRWWTKPFARVWLPYRINDAWPQSKWDAVYDLGDANNDGYRDIWIGCRPLLLCYTSGPALDSLVDGLIDVSPFGSLTNLQVIGPLMGVTKAFAVGTTDGVIYAHSDNLIPARSTRARRWPEGTLGPRMGVESTDDSGVALRPRLSDVGGTDVH